MKQVLILIVGLSLLSSATSCYAERQRHSLEQFDASKLVVWWIPPVRDDGTRFAYVMDPNNYVHHVEIGEYLGTASGLVQEITDSELVVIELRKTGDTFKEVRVVLPYPGKSPPAGSGADCPSQRTQMRETAKSLFRKNRPEKNLKDYKIRSAVFDEFVVFSFMPIGPRMAGDSPTVLVDCQTGKATFRAAE